MTILFLMNSLWSTEAILGELGSRLQRERLNQNLTQSELADRSGVSLATVKNVEAGSNFSVETLVKILRVLDKLGQIDALVPDPGISPIQLAKLRGRRRQRASGQRGKTSEPDSG
jgi:putative transcriptional regulator